MLKSRDVLKFYYDAIKLKEKIRSGWNDEHWNVTGTRRESVAEHIYGTQMLAIGIYSHFYVDVDISKVIMMLSVHETEEIGMDDFTPFEQITPEQRKQMGEKSVKETCKPLRNSHLIISLIDEFNERKTKEARYAYFCDKLDCDLQAKKYSDNGNCTIQNADNSILKDERVKKIIEEGYDTIADIFIEYDREKYGTTVFRRLLDYVQSLDINSL